MLLVFLSHCVENSLFSLIFLLAVHVAATCLDFMVNGTTAELRPLNNFRLRFLAINMPYGDMLFVGGGRMAR